MKLIILITLKQYDNKFNFHETHVKPPLRLRLGKQQHGMARHHICVDMVTVVGALVTGRAQ